jgi:hypothetical protein
MAFPGARGAFVILPPHSPIRCGPQFPLHPYSVRDASGNVVSNASPWNALCRCELLIRTASPPRSLVLVWDRASNRAPRVIPSDGSIVRTEQRDAVTLVTFVPSAPLALETNGSRRLTVDPAVPQARLLRAWAYPVR